MSGFVHKVSAKLILRILLVPSALFLLCLLCFFGQGEFGVVAFLQKSKLLTVLSIGIVIAHTTIELKVAIEDYIKNTLLQILFLKGLYVKAIVIFAIIAISVFRV